LKYFSTRGASKTFLVVSPIAKNLLELYQLV
jgi:hypothetical protein